MAVARPLPVPAVSRRAKKLEVAALAQAVTVAKFRRCTFRRVAEVKVGRALNLYQVDCMFPDRVTPLPLGDLAAAHPVCAGCTNPGIFRADSD